MEFNKQMKEIINRGREHNKYKNHIPSAQQNTSGQRRMKRKQAERDLEILKFQELESSED